MAKASTSAPPPGLLHENGSAIIKTEAQVLSAEITSPPKLDINKKIVLILLTIGGGYGSSIFNPAWLDPQ